MKRITLAMMLAAVTTTVGAQTPPVPPAQPARPAPAPAPVARPAKPIDPMDLDEMRMRIDEMKLDRLDLEPARRALEEVRAHQVEITEANREASRFAFEDMKRDAGNVAGGANVRRAAGNHADAAIAADARNAGDGADGPPAGRLWPRVRRFHAAPARSGSRAIRPTRRIDSRRTC